MNRDDIIRMAREAGWTEYSLKHQVEAQRLERFAALVAAAEREACVEVCDNLIRHGNVAEVQQRYNQAYEQCKDAIRARDAQPPIR
jgi:hypothetical protein